MCRCIVSFEWAKHQATSKHNDQELRYRSWIQRALSRQFIWLFFFSACCFLCHFSFYALHFCSGCCFTCATLNVVHIHTLTHRIQCTCRHKNWCGFNSGRGNACLIPAKTLDLCVSYIRIQSWHKNKTNENKYNNNNKKMFTFCWMRFESIIFIFEGVVEKMRKYSSMLTWSKEK